MRKKIAAANWKMNLNYDEGMSLVRDLLASAPYEEIDVVLATSFIHLEAARRYSKNVDSVAIAAQDISSHNQGAFTGEVSGQMLASVGVEYVLVGHSERRQYHRESGQIIKEKLARALENGIRPIYCCGEPLEIRKQGVEQGFVVNQLETELRHLSKEVLSQCVIAYEPIWAIGTGETATPEQAQSMHKVIRQFLADSYDYSTSESISILYGGSVKPNNAAEIFNQKDVDGGLVGGASLSAQSFHEIIVALMQK